MVCGGRRKAAYLKCLLSHITVSKDKIVGFIHQQQNIEEEETLVECKT